MEVVGDDLSLLDREAGGHRIQEIPPTERRGRVHTSTVVVAVLDPTKTRHDTALDQNEFRLEWFSGSGAGGQNRNKTKNCARITHIPTGLTASCQTRDRDSSYRGAMQALEARLREHRKRQVRESISGDRRAQMGSGQRGDKIRTYRWQDNVVTDHRTGRKAPLDQVIRGRFNLLD